MTMSHEMPRDGQPSSRELFYTSTKARPSIEDEIGAEFWNAKPVAKKQTKTRESWYNGTVGTINSVLCQMTIEERNKFFDFLDDRYCLECASVIDPERPDECPKCGEI